MKKVIAILVLVVTSSSAFARLDKSCLNLAIQESKKLAVQQNEESKNLKDKSFIALMDLNRQQMAAEDNLIDQVTKQCVNAQLKAGIKVSEKEEERIRDNVDTLVNSNVGMLHHGGNDSTAK